MTITRIDAEARWSDVVIHNQTLYYTGVPANLDADAFEQTANTLAQIDAVLEKQGSDKSRILDATIFLALFLQYLVYLDVSLAVFNLIPVPPLDGSRVLLAVLPERIYFGMMKYERVILIVLLAAVWGGFLDGPLSVMNNVVWDLLDNGTQYIDTIAYSAYYASVGAVI